MSSERLLQELWEADAAGDAARRRQLRDALAEQGSAVVPMLLERIRAGDHKLVWRVLERIGEPAVEPLRHLIQEPHLAPAVRRMALFTLAEIGDPRATEDILALLTDPDVQVRRAAATTLGMLNEHRAIPLLIELVSTTTDRSERGAYIEAIGHIEHQDATPFLLGLLRHENGSIRKKAVVALRHQMTPIAASAVVSALADPEPNVSEEASHMLPLMGAVAFDSLRRALTDRHLDPQIRGHVAWLLGRMKDTDAVLPMARVLEDPSAPTTLRMAMTDSLTMLEEPHGIPALLQALRDPEPAIRKAAATALGGFAGPPALASIEVVAQQDEDAAVRAAARHAVARIRKRAHLPLADQDDPDGAIVARFGRFHLHLLRPLGTSTLPYQLGVTTAEGDLDLPIFVAQPDREEVLAAARKQLAACPRSQDRLRAEIAASDDLRFIERMRIALRAREHECEQLRLALEDLKL